MSRIKIIAGYSLVGSVFISAAMLLSMKFLGDEGLSYNTGEILGYITLLLGFMAIYLALKRLRDEHYNGHMGFWKAFGNGMLMVGIVSLVYAIVWIAFVNYQGEEFLLSFFEAALENEPSAEVREEMRANFEFYKMPAFQFIMALVEILPVGILVSLVSAFLLNRK